MHTARLYCGSWEGLSKVGDHVIKSPQAPWGHQTSDINQGKSKVPPAATFWCKQRTYTVSDQKGSVWGIESGQYSEW